MRLGWEIRNVIKLTGTGFGLKVLCALGNIVRLTGTGLRLRLVLMLFGDLGNGFVSKKSVSVAESFNCILYQITFHGRV